jgi:hypothetical protein
MVTLPMFIARFPEFTSISQGRFDIFFGDAVIEMGNDDGRWINVYDVAQAYLIAHNLSVAQASEAGDINPMMPIRSSDVDDVLVEYAVAREIDGTLDNYDCTIYGQTYLKWRNQAFAGARMIY